MPSGRSKEIRMDWNWMEHVSSWYMLTMWIYWLKTYRVKKNTEALLEAIKKVGLEVNADKTKYMVMSHHHRTKTQFTDF